MINFVMQQLIRVLTPSSPAYNNQPGFYNDQQSQDEIIKQLKPGDIILSRTGSLIYEIVRGWMHIQYDHAAVVINKKQGTHFQYQYSQFISPLLSFPNSTLKVQSGEDRYPIIFRPSLSQQQTQHFLSILHGFLGQKYNVQAIPKIILGELKRRISNFSYIPKQQQQKQNQNEPKAQSTVVIENDQPNHMNLNEQPEFSHATLKFSRICSDAIVYALCRSKKQMEEITKQTMDSQSSYQMYGFTLPDDLITIMTKTKSRIIYKSIKSRKENPIVSIVQQIKQYYQKVKEFPLAQNKGVKFAHQLLKKGLQLKTYYLQITLVLSLILKICQLLGYKTSSTSSNVIDILSIAFMVLLFSVFSSQSNDKIHAIKPRL